MYKIFINEHPLIISHDKEDLKKFGKFNFAQGESREDFIRAVEYLEFSDKKNTSIGLLMPTDDADATFENFQYMFEPIIAGGGIVYNDKDEILLIKRQGKWDLPKGKRDENETIEEAALREVKEECGIDDLVMVKKVTESYHTYWMEGRRVLKTTHWYEMSTRNYHGAIPQLEENISELRWFKKESLNLDNLDTYNSIVDLLKNI